MNNKEIPRFEWDNEDRFTICATAGGRILYITGELIYFIGQNPTGRNLNDLIPDEQAADIIANARQGTAYSFECTIDKCLFSCTSRQADQEIKITMFPVNDPREVFIDKNAAALISGEMNESLHLMRLYLASLEKNQGSENLAQTAGVINRQIYRLNRLARNVYDTAMWVNGSLRPSFAKEDVAALCRKLADEMEPLLESMSIRLLTDIPQHPVIAMVDKEKTERMLLNLIANSIKALSDDRVIILVLTSHPTSFSITVTDHGAGADMDAVFGKSANMESGDLVAWKSAGFGISLVRAYAKSHGGAFIITSKPGSKTVARITLPYNLEREDNSVHTLTPEYSGGLSMIHTELSTVLSSEHYELKPRKKR